MNKEVLILGGGPAGMAAAFELHKVGKSFVVIERNEAVGGLARTLQYGEFKTDIGGHRFFSQNRYLYDLIEDLLGEHWIKVDRSSKFYIDGKFFVYPIELKNAFLNVGFWKALKILFDYLSERIKKMFVNREPTSFEEQVVSDFGRALAELNILNYTEKVWGLPCAKISPDWAKQRIKGLSFKEVIKKAIIKSEKGPKTLVEQFYYPDTGIGLICEKIRERILNGKVGDIFLKSYPVKIFHNNDKVTEVMVNIEGKHHTIRPRFVISSIPITEFIDLLEPKAPNESAK